MLSMKKALVNRYANYYVWVHRDHLVKTDCRDTQDREEKLYVTFHFNANHTVLFTATEAAALTYASVSA